MPLLSLRCSYLQSLTTQEKVITRSVSLVLNIEQAAKLLLFIETSQKYLNSLHAYEKVGYFLKNQC